MVYNADYVVLRLHVGSLSQVLLGVDPPRSVQAEKWQQL